MSVCESISSSRLIPLLKLNRVRTNFLTLSIAIWAVANIAFGWLVNMSFDREIREQVFWLIRNHMKVLDLKVMPICEVVPC